MWSVQFRYLLNVICRSICRNCGQQVLKNLFAILEYLKKWVSLSYQKIITITIIKSISYNVYSTICRRSNIINISINLQLQLP